MQTIIYRLTLQFSKLFSMTIGDKSHHDDDNNFYNPSSSLSSSTSKLQILITIAISIFSIVTTFFMFAQGILKWEEIPFWEEIKFKRIAETHSKVVILLSDRGTINTTTTSSSLLNSAQLIQPIPFKYYYNDTEYFEKYSLKRQIDTNSNILQLGSISKTMIGKAHYECSKKHLDTRLVKVFGPFKSAMEHVYFLRIESFDRYDLDSPYFQLFHARIVEKESEYYPTIVNTTNFGDYDTGMAVSFTKFIPIVETRQFNENIKQYVNEIDDIEQTQLDRENIFIDIKQFTSKRNKRVYIGQFFLPRLKGGEFQVDIRMMHHCFSAKQYSSPSFDFSESFGIQIARIPFSLERKESISSSSDSFESHRNYVIQEYAKFKTLLQLQLFGDNLQDPYQRLAKKIFDEKFGLWIRSSYGNNCDNIICKMQNNDNNQQLLFNTIGTNQVYVPIHGSDMSTHSGEALTHPYYIYSAQEVHNCFHGKRIAFFGDSSVDELFSRILDWLIEYDPSVSQKFKFLREFNGRKLKKANLRYCVVEHDKFIIKSRGLAHAFPDQKWGGIKSILELEAARNELTNIALESDVAVMTFTFHEMAGHYGIGGFKTFDTQWIFDSFAPLVSQFFKLVNEWHVKNRKLRILWREVVPSHDPRVGPELIFALTNTIIRREIAKYEDFIEYVPLEQTTFWGNSFKGIHTDGLHNEKRIAMMNAQILLNHMCKKR
ncbi:hypothetical protein NAEGRDRAFT_59024 [Naegleria gruberi]|uniref:Uncharacterized protein n=1 Tax=Naegleria gruberi TaxID=5762 RepID=D2VRK2_NAEGR|nr:uncharacterized protein NAEGRDRAFT_59024 [Naegleria gruberi]EFC40476.1 hypothetical protein NAEGRDRAFT_59024 [Naegleria gruberi]|eukprot:XP_002673220.1 hypothetical protein NAEGRDRAFT_59024 [Naegleria gruberi strain NEG-M]